MSPSFPPPSAEGLEVWGRFHLAAHGRMTQLAAALLTRDWELAEAVCAWVREELVGHVEAEASVFIPLLQAAGAPHLGTQLQRDNQAMLDLVAELPPAGPSSEEALRRLLDLVRQHVDTEAFAVLPLLKDRGLLPEAAFGARDPDARRGWERWRNLPGSGR
jgi:hypothetical protein